jgi:thioredoxin-related protein
VLKIKKWKGATINHLSLTQIFDLDSFLPQELKKGTSMKFRICKMMLSIMLGAILIASANLALAASIQWQSYSNSAFTKAKAQKKLVLVYVGSESCHWCAKMNNETFHSPAIINIISKKFIPVSVDMMSEPSISYKFDVRGTPTFIILDSNSQEVSRTVGYQSTNEFQSYLSGF